MRGDEDGAGARRRHGRGGVTGPPHGKSWSDRIATLAVNDNDTARIDRLWVADAVSVLVEEHRRATETPLIRLDCPELAATPIYLKDESAHPTGSLKHRLAHSLFLHALCNGNIGPRTTIVEASSGSTAISEAWFARLLGLAFIAVVPEGTAPAKLAAIRGMGGEVVAVPEGADIRVRAAALARERAGFFMDQFGRALEATDWRGANTIAQSLFAQLAGEALSIPAWVVVGAGTGGTSATIGRYIRLNPALHTTRLCVVDPEGSAFFAAYAGEDPNARERCSPIVEGIGRAQVEPAFNIALVDHMLSISDIGSVAGAHWLEQRTGRRFGPSTGTNIIGALLLAQSMGRRGLAGSIVTLACDRGERYADTIYDPAWLDARGLDLGPWRSLLDKLGAFIFPDAFG